MTRKSTSTVIVGIDGSQASLHAAQWAVDEALSRDLPLRLIYVTKPKHPSPDDYYEDVHRGRAALEHAATTVEALGKPVKVETAVLDGPSTPTLIEQSSDADMVCVGTVGIGRYAQSILGSTAAELAEKAHCPVAVIRPPEGDAKPTDWIVVALGKDPDDEVVVDHAMREAELRRAPVLVLGDSAGRDDLDERIAGWRDKYPQVHVYPLADESDVTEFLKKHHERVQLAVVGTGQAGDLTKIVGPHGHPVFHHTHSSALVVRS
ncbi:universal stress protein [Mycobacterium sp. Y57]|uniref:universal stress protein n=1 Tax=Mycolicibacterium xanthum TaxID=2796469 RepID=UPI001C866D6F|nr:universal stress protein [Mycolicibacterium xanthum]MBX7433669.1 universal stress protein [Mycolicibacterium xanthum]